MLLKSVKIENFRSIKDTILYCDELTALVGTNGSGKSSLLRAIELFYNRSSNVKIEDYHNRQTDTPIKITAIFSDLPESIKNKYHEYVVKGCIEVVSVLEWDEEKHKSKQTYYGKKRQDPNLKFINTMSLTESKRKYSELRKTSEYKDLPALNATNDIKTCITEWNKTHPKRCEMLEDDGKIFKHSDGFPDSFMQFVHVEPVRDATKDAQEDKNSTLGTLMDLVVKRTIMRKKSVQEFTKKTQEEYDSMLLTAEQRELSELGNSMTETINKFVSGAKVKLSWSKINIPIDLPPAKITLEEDMYQSEVNMTGHGLQRIFIMCILQHLSEAKTTETSNDNKNLQTTLLLIDEPELYQHPNRQRHMASVLYDLVKKNQDGTSNNMQIIYSTHSPHFVGIDRLNYIRIVRKTAIQSGEPSTTKIQGTSIDEIKSNLNSIECTKNLTQNLEHILQTIMTPMINEGFFADLAILVEGDTDRVALMATAESMNCQLEKLGVSVIQCGGKRNLAIIVAIFQHFGIQLYCVWDSDQGGCAEYLNPALLSILNKPSEDQISHAYKTHAILNGNLEKTIENYLGGKYTEYKRRCMTYLCLKKYNSQPHAISYMVRAAMKDKIKFQLFEEIIKNVVKQRS